jgi:class 3 adenylate cyclase
VSFRFKLILVMAALVSGVSIVTLLVNQKIVQQQYRHLVLERLDGQAEALRESQAARLEGVLTRVRDASGSVRIVAALLAESDDRPKQIYADFGEELEDVLGGARSTKQAFFRVFDYDYSVIPDLMPIPGLDADALTERLIRLLPPFDAEFKTTSGYLAFEDSLYETIVHPVYDASSGEFLCALVLLLEISDPQQLLGRAPGAKLALEVAGKRFGDEIPEGEMVMIEDQRHEVFTQPIRQDPGFDPARQISAFSLNSLEQALSLLRSWLLIFGLGALMIALLLSFLVSGQISKPLSQLTRQTREILAGNLGATIPVRSKDEIGVLTESFNEMSEGLALKERYRAVLDRVTDPRVAEELTRGKLELGGEERQTSILFCDIRGFTSLTEDMSPTDIVAMLNHHMTALTEVAARHNGVVDKFIGDEIMILFGSPHTYENDARDAVRCAVEMIERRRELNETSDFPINVGIGIATGPVLAGCMGSEKRLNYTTLGARVNLAARLCSKATALEILIDDATYEHVKDQIPAETVGEVELKGFREKALVYRVS